MKVVGFDEFAALPEGTIFSYYKPCICEGLYRKGETLYREKIDPTSGLSGPFDFFECSLVPMCWNGEPPIADDINSRWGMYDFDQQFAVFEEKDLAVLRELLGDTE